MDKQKLAISFVAVYIVNQILGYLIHQVWLSPTYGSMPEVWRPEADMTSKMWIMFVTSAVWSFFFCYIYARGYQGKGILEGVRYGMIIGLFFALVQSYEAYMVYPITLGLAHSWFLAGLGSSIVSGIVVALIYKPDTA